MAQGLDECGEFFVEVQAGGCGMQAEEILPLAHPDDDRDAGRESHDHRTGNETDHAAEPRDAQHQQDHAGHQGRCLQATRCRTRP